ncbi:putative serine incorporator/TMS membrane protein [Helianthus anomalus]
MTSWWKRGRFTTTPAFFLFLWCPPNCIYGVHIQFNIPNLLFFFLKDWGPGTPVTPMWVRPCLQVTTFVNAESTSKIGSGLFLLVQVVLLLDFVHSWNDKWVGYDEQFWYAALLIVSLVCYVATFSFSGLLFYLFTPSGQDCGLNTFFIVMTLILVFVFAVITLHPTVSGSILPASVISLYCMYLCYSGLASEPRDYACNGLHKHSKAVSTGTLTVGLLTTVLSVVYSAVRAGSSTTLLSPPSSPRAGTFKKNC